MPFTVRDMQAAGIALALSLSLLSCAPQIERTPLPHLPPLEEGPHDDPARDAQSRLLREAYRAFLQARYPTAVLFFRRFIDGSPDSPRIPEARWWLGRTYEELGDYRSAMTQYRIVASIQLSQQPEAAEYADHALRRLDELRQVHADLNRGAKQVALRLNVNHMPSMPALSSWLENLSHSGVTGLIVEPAQGSDRRLPGPARVKEMVTEAHRLGLLVWMGLDVHQAQRDLNPEWLNQKLDAGIGQTTSVPRPDITNSEYLVFLETLVREISQSGCDGIFFPARLEPGFGEEFSDSSFQRFASSFGVDLSPRQVLGTADAGLPPQEKMAVYWRWVGWKALAYSKLIARLRTVIRGTQPTAGLLLEVHQATLYTPLAGLEQYGEDVAELAQRTGGAIVVRRDGQDGEGRIEQLGQQLGTPERLWVEIPSDGALASSYDTALQSTVADMRAYPGGHIIIMPQLTPAVP